jgi:hypothetical protein
MLDLNGFSNGERPDLVARPSSHRIAPVTASFYGYEGSYGGEPPLFDHIITDISNAPPEYASTPPPEGVWSSRARSEEGSGGGMLAEALLLLPGCKFPGGRIDSLPHTFHHFFRLCFVHGRLFLLYPCKLSISKNMHSKVAAPPASSHSLVPLTRLLRAFQGGDLVSASAVKDGSFDREAEAARPDFEKAVLQKAPLYSPPAREGQSAPFVFCCFAKIFKVQPVIAQAWFDVLRQAPNSLLWLLSYKK